MNENMAQQTLAKLHEILKKSPTLDVAKALMGIQDGNVQKDYPSGLVAYDLQEAARVLQPVITPLRNMIPRVGGVGGNATNWLQITALDTNKTNTFSAFGVKAPVVNYSSTPRAATYKSMALGDNVSIEQIQQARGLENARANMSIRLLENVMIMEEQNIITGRVGNLGAVTAPTTTTNAAGGTIAANTYYVVVRALTGQGRSTAAANIAAAGAITSRGRKSNQTAIICAGATSVINATWPVVDGAFGYEVYVGTVNDNVSQKLEAITQIKLGLADRARRHRRRHHRRQRGRRERVRRPALAGQRHRRVR